MSLAFLSPLAPIGVFDSGIGGLSVLQALRQQLPHESFVYYADSAHAPYGEKSAEFVAERSHAISAQLIADHSIKALVIACNTATAAAVHSLRAAYPHLPLVGIEPAIKPAAALTRTGRVGLAATRGTLQSEKFARLLAQHQGHTQWVCHAFSGLAKAIEDRPDADASDADRDIDQLIRSHLRAMGEFGTAAGQIDTLVLGCTHYPLVKAQFAACLGAEIQLLETGQPVAKQTAKLLQTQALLRPESAPRGELLLRTSAQPAHIERALAFWHIA